ncbi:DUF3866 family protein [Geosporobacter ferrireducens]|uniref:DUF3866 domain-containing protein n=1 Tax=Geosporobacter ferrireducens TaxID=1424294 RepID=A0A1D8GB44_9FIRM|nr:DUF3866 family protein [Geosporobacter ferrireducens]AOT68135.1 hypothetical protein Gferi_00190 [Geosporobacter ferrireducens]MTI54182.1 DUF3866 family protein [Geosporobacter ferrireducens]
MLSVKIGKVVRIIREEAELTEIMVDIDDHESRAINYNQLSGGVEVGDRILLNTTAVELQLGTGGYHFVISNLAHPEHALTPGGHIMKLRYTPYQLKVFSSEEQESPYHEVFNSFESLQQMPILVGTLHSMLAPVVSVLKHYKPDCKIAYIMTDGAALPASLSNVVRNLKKESMIAGTITVGNAFGGDLDCINIYNGLIAAKEVLKCDAAVVAMGPGIVGTGTKYGFTGIEQGNILDAVNDLSGSAIAIPRISFADARERHHGLSHHSITVLEKIVKTKVYLGIPSFEQQKKEILCNQITTAGIQEKHTLQWIEPEALYNILKNSKLKFSTMGRGLEEDREFFITAAAAAQLAISCLTDHE